MRKRMKEPWTSKVKQFFRRVICKLTGHEHGCCNEVLKPCRKCIHVKEEPIYEKGYYNGYADGYKRGYADRMEEETSHFDESGDVTTW